MKHNQSQFLLVALISILLSFCMSCSDASIPSEVQKLHSAAERGDPNAMAFLGHRYMTGDGVPINYTEALKWFERGTAQGKLVCENCLAWLLATCPDDRIRDGSRAVILAEKVVAKDRSSANMDTLAAAYAEVGSFSQAIRTQEEATSKLSVEEGIIDRLTRYSGYRDRLESYRDHKPWRKP
jgi:hypothetical protein